MNIAFIHSDKSICSLFSLSQNILIMIVINLFFFINEIPVNFINNLYNQSFLYSAHSKWFLKVMDKVAKFL